MPKVAPAPAPTLPWYRRLPGLCLLCGQWQRQSICHECELALAAPTTRCLRCALNVGEGRSHCAACEDYPPPFERAVAALDYVSPWSDLIARFKFQGEVALAQPLAGMLAGRLSSPATRGRVRYIIPTPLSAARLRERGYNQSWLLAQALSRRLGLVALPDALRRVKDTPRMMSLEADERRHHIRHAFEVVPARRRQLAGHHVAVVDDVLTTGATAQEITRTLQEAGVRSVAVWVVARTRPPRATDLPA